MFFQGYSISAKGWSIWPFKYIFLKWPDITRVITFIDGSKYCIIIKYVKNGKIKALEFRSKANRFFKYVCEILPSEKTCLVTRELVGYDANFKKDKCRQSELVYQEVLARQLWLELKPKQALEVCNEILEKDPNNFWGMKVKAFILNGFIGDFATANGIIEKMINLKYYDPYTFVILVENLILQKADPDKIDNYMALFRKQVTHPEFLLEFDLLNYYLDILKDYQKAEELLKILEPVARKMIDPVYIKYINEFYDKRAKLKAGNND